MAHCQDAFCFAVARLGIAQKLDARARANSETHAQLQLHQRPAWRGADLVPPKTQHGTARRSPCTGIAQAAKSKANRRRANTGAIRRGACWRRPLLPLMEPLESVLTRYSRFEERGAPNGLALSSLLRSVTAAAAAATQEADFGTSLVAERSALA